MDSAVVSTSNIPCLAVTIKIFYAHLKIRGDVVEAVDSSVKCIFVVLVLRKRIAVVGHIPYACL